MTRNRFHSLTLSAMLFGGLFSATAHAYLLPCQLVTQMAGSHIYQAKLDRVGSMLAPDELPAQWNLSLLERHGGWFIYQTPQVWFERQTCGPLTKRLENGAGYGFMPVLLNQKTGHNAVLTGTFVLKTYRPEHLSGVIERYGFKLLTMLPKQDSAIVDVKPLASYDDMIEVLDKDRDVDLIAPLLSEPMYRLR
ncbi:MAG: hypothetical protein JXR44_09555 [Thiotrichales bacterium]|nr:hypothetical protein [Thiotrichales bacterium]